VWFEYFAVKYSFLMTAFAFPNLEGGGVAPISPGVGGKIIQRIRPAAGSYPVKARCMADADNDLVLQSQNGSVAAFETLIRNHQTMIHALTFRMTGSSADAEDLAQETFISAHEQINHFKGGAKFSTWLYSIAVHACLNWRRNEARRFQTQANCAKEMLTQQTDADNLPNEMARQAQAALMKLPAKQRAAIVLVIYDGLNHAEAAKVLRCSETTVSWRIFAAKRKLKCWLMASGKQP
jgi:RNA polymerase sigma-70 factor (ECF subfamily)